METTCFQRAISFHDDSTPPQRVTQIIPESSDVDFQNQCPLNCRFQDFSLNSD